MSKKVIFLDDLKKNIPKIVILITEIIIIYCLNVSIKSNLTKALDTNGGEREISELAEADSLNQLKNSEGNDENVMHFPLSEDDENAIQPPLSKNVTERVLLIFATLSYWNPLKPQFADEKIKIISENEVHKEKFEYDAERMFITVMGSEVWAKSGFGGYPVSPGEIKGWKLIKFDINRNNTKKGFSAITFRKENDIVFAFRGTDEGLSENIRYVLPFTEHSQACFARQYVEESLKELKQEIKEEELNKIKFFFTGHSLGGYLSLYGGGVFLDLISKTEEVKTAEDKIVSTAGQDKILNFTADKNFGKIVIFNALGLGRGTNSNIKKMLGNLKKGDILSFCMEGDGISYYGNHYAEKIRFKFQDLQSSPYGRAYYWIFGPHGMFHFFGIKRFQSPIIQSKYNGKSPL
jgi:hypothetical protein